MHPPSAVQGKFQIDSSTLLSRLMSRSKVGSPVQRDLQPSLRRESGPVSEEQQLAVSERSERFGGEGAGPAEDGGSSVQGEGCEAPKQRRVHYFSEESRTRKLAERIQSLIRRNVLPSYSPERKIIKYLLNKKEAPDVKPQYKQELVSKKIFQEHFESVRTNYSSVQSCVLQGHSRRSQVQLSAPACMNATPTCRDATPACMNATPLHASTTGDVYSQLELQTPLLERQFSEEKDIKNNTLRLLDFKQRIVNAKARTRSERNAHQNYLLRYELDSEEEQSCRDGDGRHLYSVNKWEKLKQIKKMMRSDEIQQLLSHRSKTVEVAPKASGPEPAELKSAGRADPKLAGRADLKLAGRADPKSACRADPKQLMRQFRSQVYAEQSASL